mmetsp:Transcript_7449/g.8851  ORF Transcript_7449/g.8851 Transcript_7449/m.8851 type:complete len:224 (+) Transcript_7449:178-849(+)|eukprot:CAMPEP_0114334810 /NCGR_PEP_ID=MMETSP0101-20121206/4632_1 /TAXON_ID=38822 ORGANISM="Pteridomonas danica, Strain PT" /NCGR_SAMPLE_ID=MMETSP0101 /ASSEMBLY_ACC=CAM_ASM_000211 /LENGTH=223 /DNA_ID=CAMNT_0001466211 /DNA_START=171 /DNA_END=842 /DNA_ORIENTATION=+
MGAGASIPEDKMSKFKAKLLALDTLNDNNKNRLLEQMAYELKKLEPKDGNDQAAAAAKIQALQRKNGACKASESGNMGGGDDLQGVFSAFCATYRQQSMTNTVWAKFCKDAKLLDKKYTKPDIDMVWSKVAGKEKKLGFESFKKLLGGVAGKKGCSYDEVEAHVLNNAKVSSSGTKGESRFYDDKSTWTGAAVKGGPTTNDNVQTLSSLSNRDNKADVRGVVS